MFLSNIFVNSNIIYSKWEPHVIIQNRIKDSHITRALIYLAVMLIAVVLLPNVMKMKNKFKRNIFLIITPVMIAYCITLFGNVSEFIYFNF